MSELGRVVVMGWGVVHASVCAEKDLTREEVADETNRLQPTGIESRWAVSEDPTFKGGEPNPCPCPVMPDRQHFLLVC